MAATFRALVADSPYPTASELARASGVSVSAICAYMRGSSPCRPRPRPTALRLWKAIGCTLVRTVYEAIDESRRRYIARKAEEAEERTSREARLRELAFRERMWGYEPRDD